MFLNYFKIAWRNLFKEGQFSLLNLIGLSTGLTCAILIFLWVKDEKGMDTFHENDEQLYQVMQNIRLGDGSIITIPNTPGLLAQTLKEKMPEVENSAASGWIMGGQSEGIISHGETKLKANERYVHPNFFELFSFPVLKGNSDNFLNEKFNVLVSKQMALKLFDTTDNIIGKTINWDRGTGNFKLLNGPYVISGIFENPGNSSLQFDLLFSYKLFYENFKDKILNLQSWANSNPQTYVILKEGTNITEFNEKLKNFAITETQADKNGINRFFVQPFQERYLNGNYTNGKVSGGRIHYIKLFSLIAVFVLTMACINFMNLSTARASRRMKEIGIKKVIGASRGNLVLQYLTESVLMSFVALVLAIGLVLLLLSSFNTITGKELSIQLEPGIIAGILIITLLTGLLAGSYPAFFLSGFRPASILKGNIVHSIREFWIRKGLVVFQFTLSVFFIIAVLVIYNQTKLIHDKDLGFNKNHIISFQKEGSLYEDIDPFISELNSTLGVKQTSTMHGNLTGDHGGTSSIEWDGKAPGESVQFGNIEVDYGFIELLDIQMKLGRSFSKEFGAENSKIIFNEAAIEAMGLSDPIGKTIRLWGEERQIIGVVKDFNFESLYNEVKPCFLQLQTNMKNILVKIEPGMEEKTIQRIENLYNRYNPELPFDYKFLDEDYQRLYEAENRVLVLSKYFAGLAILISCLGLFGLAAFTAQKRKKEISIRKVLGASVKNITAMLSKDFIRLVIIAILIGFPISWLVMQEWLDDFAYQTKLDISIFLIAGFLLLCMSIITVSFQAIKAAIGNPIKGLRTE